jgi:hypothetical protein
MEIGVRAQDLQRVSLLGAKEDDAESLDDMSSKLGQVRGLIGSMEQLVKQEPAAKRDLWKQKVANMRDECIALERLLEREQRRAGKNKVESPLLRGSTHKRTPTRPDAPPRHPPPDPDGAGALQDGAAGGRAPAGHDAGPGPAAAGGLDAESRMAIDRSTAAVRLPLLASPASTVRASERPQAWQALPAHGGQTRPPAVARTAVAPGRGERAGAAERGAAAQVDDLEARGAEIMGNLAGQVCRARRARSPARLRASAQLTPRARAGGGGGGRAA